MKWRHGGLAASLLSVALLSACAQAGDTAQLRARQHFPNDPVAALYANAYDDIQQYYIEPIDARTMAVAGLQAVIPPNSHVKMSVGPDTVSFTQDGTVLRQLREPAAEDADGWAAVTSAGLATLRRAVPGMDKEPEVELDRTVFHGIIDKLDRFTRYAPPEQATRLRDARDGFGGIGIILKSAKPNEVQQSITVNQVLPNTPASRAGLTAGDRIVTVDGTSIAGLVTEKIIDRLRGPIGSKVVLGILHPGAKAPITAELQRALIVEPSVVVENRPGGIVVLTVAEFNHDTAETLSSAIMQSEKATPGGLKGIVLDLRGDPGGLLDQAADVASIFIKHGRVVTTRGRHPESMQVFDADSTRYLTDLPMVVLVNGGSASAAEIVSAALQDSGRAVLIGSSSFGKGTVQVVLTLENDGELTVTWARLFSPGNTVLHHHGVVPLFCTSGAKNADAVITQGLGPKPALATAPRASLSEADWQALRASCAPDETMAPLDVDVATKLLQDHALYAKAIARSKLLGTPVKLSSIASLPPP
jgi:carboxyl-terminal processing protease